MYQPSFPVNSIPEAPPVRSSAVKAGLVCLGIGVLTFWIFGLGFLFFSITFICGVVAMCTNQVKEGLMLIFAAILSIWGCLVIFMMFFVGMFAALLGGAVKQASTLPPPALPSPNQMIQQQGALIQSQAQKALNPLFQDVRAKSAGSSGSKQFDAEAARRRKELNDLRRRQGSPEAPDILFGGGNSR